MALRGFTFGLRQMAISRPRAAQPPLFLQKSSLKAPLWSSFRSQSTAVLGTRQNKRLFTSASSHPPSGGPTGSAPIGSVFDLTPEQYAELKEPRIPQDFQYQTFTSQPPETEDDAIFEPQHLDLYSVADLLAKRRYSAVIKRAMEILEPHRSIIQSGFPSHDPTLHAELRHELAECLGLLCLSYMHQENYDYAIDTAIAAAELAPTSDRYSDLASHLLQAGRNEEAVHAAEKAIELDPYTEVDALVTKAYALWRMKRFDGHDILSLCDLALARDPYATGAMDVKAQYLAHIGRINDALRTIDRALAKDDDNFHLVRLKTGFLEQTGQLPLALTTVLKFFKEDPESLEAHREAARIALLLNDWTIAIEHLKFVVSHSKSPSEGHADLAHALTQNGQVEEASEVLNTAIQLNSAESIAFAKPYRFPSLKRSLTVKKKKMNEL